LEAFLAAFLAGAFFAGFFFAAAFAMVISLSLKKSESFRTSQLCTFLFLVLTVKSNWRRDFQSLQRKVLQHVHKSGDFDS